MGVLRKATEEVKTIALDETDYIVVRADITKREFNALAGAMPAVAEGGTGLSVADAAGFQRVLFDTLVVGWSLTEGKPTSDDYESLSAEAGLVLDTKLAEHFESLLPSSAEGK
jgi:hypothetical protein